MEEHPELCYTLDFEESTLNDIPGWARKMLLRISLKPKRVGVLDGSAAKWIENESLVTQ